MDQISNPFFSIITPVLNGERYVDNFIQSLLSQNFQNWECILINDGSKDDSFQILKSKIKNDSRFKITKTNIKKKLIKSPYLARNKGLDLAIGIYICFLDIDDYWLPNKLSQEFKLIKDKQNPELILGSYIKANKNLSFGYRKPRIDFIPIKWQVKIWNPCPLLATTILNKKIDSTRFEAFYHEDYRFWYLILKKIKSHKIIINDQYLCIYRSSPKSQSSNKFKAAIWIFKCYESFKYHKLICLFLLFIKIISEVIEKFLICSGSIKIKKLIL